MAGQDGAARDHYLSIVTSPVLRTGPRSARGESLVGDVTVTLFPSYIGRRPPRPPSIDSHTHSSLFTTTFSILFTNERIQFTLSSPINMVRPLTKVVYQPDPTVTNEYVVLVNPDEVRWFSVASGSRIVTLGILISIANGKKEVRVFLFVSRNEVLTASSQTRNYPFPSNVSRNDG